MTDKKYLDELKNYIAKGDNKTVAEKLKDMDRQYAKCLLELAGKGVSIEIIHDAFSKAEINALNNGYELRPNPYREALTKWLNLMRGYKRTLNDPCPNALASYFKTNSEIKTFRSTIFATEIEDTWQELRFHIIRGNILFERHIRALEKATGKGLKLSKDPQWLKDCKVTLYYELEKHFPRRSALEKTLKLLDFFLPEQAQNKGGELNKRVNALDRLIRRNKTKP